MELPHKGAVFSGQYFSITASLGSTESLVVPPQMMSSRDLTAEQAAISGVAEGTVRPDEAGCALLLRLMLA